MFQAVGADNFNHVLNDPVLFNWVTDQIQKDREEKVEFVSSIMKSIQPWLNLELYHEIEKRKQEEEKKILSLAKTDDVSKVETVNAFDSFMNKLGITPDTNK